jgi:crotonobetainyl-CoA:carnitine CoA-transferase CaiB-like acyl-CoA transferase
LGGAAVVERGRLLGLAVAVLGERAPGPLWTADRIDDAPPLERPPLVVDLSSLWAGPLCGRILLERGARVVKVESPSRPDGARSGDPVFFEGLNGAKEQVTLPLDSTELRRLLLDADVVIEGSRPRALEQVGIDAASLVASGPRVWLSITAHGRSGPARDWVGFGDDAAVAGGLVAWDDVGPCFLADAVADPLTGMAGAVAVSSLLEEGGRWLVDCNLAGVAAHVAAA